LAHDGGAGDDEDEDITQQQQPGGDLTDPAGMGTPVINTGTLHPS
jgi:hypothetical protein